MKIIAKKKMMVKRLRFCFLGFISMFLIAPEANAQDPAFSQFYANPLYLNPAFTGTSMKGCPRVNLNFRDQWPGIRAYMTTSASYDQAIDAIEGGFGVLISDDRSGAGSFRIQQASLLYSYHLPVNNSFAINTGFEASYRMVNVGWENLKFGDMIDPTYGFVKNTQEDIDNYEDGVSYPDFSTGFIGYSENYFFGFAAHHLATPNQSFMGTESPLPTKYTFHAGGKFPLFKYSNVETTISPNFLYQQQQDFQQFNYGLYVTRGPIVGGLWTRHSDKNIDSYILLVGLIQETFKFGYSYDITASNLGVDNTLGAHEVSFSMYLPCRSKVKSFNTINCPQF
ncbi:MAG: PorP/SprF family type IX secretion system membrane protein [Bacteroidota bacterium]|nr:PorP/SprF family type IX secretion system membrane protein [Bacteroidota bacterium]